MLQRIGERRVDPPTLGLRQVAETLGRVRHDRDALDALRHDRRVVGEEPDDEVRDVRPRLAVDRNQTVIGIEFEFGERVGRQPVDGRSVR